MMKGIDFSETNKQVRKCLENRCEVSPPSTTVSLICQKQVTGEFSGDVNLLCQTMEVNFDVYQSTKTGMNQAPLAGIYSCSEDWTFDKHKEFTMDISKTRFTLHEPSKLQNYILCFKSQVWTRTVEIIYHSKTVDRRFHIILYSIWFIRNLHNSDLSGH